jgi:copper chaperone CopZ
MNRFAFTLIFLSSLTGCAQQSVDTSVSSGDETTAVAFNLGGDPTVEFNVPDMMCPEGCGEKTKEILAAQPGAKEVVIDFEAKTATVAVDKDKFDVDAAIAALVDYGFEHSTLKSGAKQSETAAAPAASPAG